MTLKVGQLKPSLGVIRGEGEGALIAGLGGLPLPHGRHGQAKGIPNEGTVSSVRYGHAQMPCRFAWFSQVVKAEPQVVMACPIVWLLLEMVAQWRHGGLPSLLSDLGQPKKQPSPGLTLGQGLLSGPS